MKASPDTRHLFTFEFFALCLIIVAAFCNVSVFYSFYHYLGDIDVPLVWRGFLVGLEPMAAFALRLLVLPWLHLRNAYAITMSALALLIAVSCSYLWVTSLAGLMVLRIAHGAVFVLLTSAAISLLVHFIPAEKSAQGFSALAVATMIPYAIIPPATEALMPYVQSAADIYAAVSVFSLAGIALMILLRARIAEAIGRMDASFMRRLNPPELRDNFRRRSVRLLLCVILFVYLAHAAFFYFLKDLTVQTGMGNPGVFFAVSMSTMIGVRIGGAFVFDRFHKTKIVMASLIALAVCAAVLPGVKTAALFYLLGALYGGCMGVILPVLSALLFSASAPELRGLNTNLTLFTMDAGYFLAPYLGGAVIAAGAGFGSLFYAAAGLTLLSIVLLTLFDQHERRIKK